MGQVFVQCRSFLLHLCVCVCVSVGSNLLVRWKNTDHEGVFPLEWLKENDYSTDERRREKFKVQQPLIAVRTL